MSHGPITHACRTFLAQHNIDPADVSRALVEAALRGDHDPYRRLQLQGTPWECWIGGGDEFNDAFLEYDPGSGNTLLKVKRRRFWYREHGTGLAELVIFNRRLPEVVCLGFSPDRYRLSQLVATDSEAFYLKSDPLVRGMHNVRRLGWPAIVMTLVPIWAEENWNYSKGAGEWAEQPASLPS